MKTTSLTMKTQKDGKPYKQFVMEDGNKLSVFNFDTRYNEIDVGTDLPESVLIFDPAYSNYKLRPLPKGAQVKTATGYKTAQVEKMMDKKEASIEKFVDRKEGSMHLLAAQRDAVLMVTTLYKSEPFMSDEELRAKIKEWMRYFVGVQEQPFL